MAWWQLALIAVAVAAIVWIIAIASLLVVGRRSGAIALARFVPDCLVLFRRLVADERVPRARKFVLVALLGYLALPFDVIPDFIPVAGQLDDAVVVAIGLRFVLRAGGEELVREHWPGPEESLSVLVRFAFAGTGPAP
jgi:uncharacterized membrane protein YkvA (DUF1232 family)